MVIAWAGQVNRNIATCIILDSDIDEATAAFLIFRTRCQDEVRVVLFDVDCSFFLPAASLVSIFIFSGCNIDRRLAGFDCKGVIVWASHGQGDGLAGFVIDIYGEG